MFPEIEDPEVLNVEPYEGPSYECDDEGGDQDA